MPEPITVLIVDDSRVFRAALEETLRDQADIEVVGSVFSGAKALECIRSSPPRVVTLDVEMPGMDGLATLEQIQAFNATRPAADAVGVIMVSAFTRRGADITMKALQAGAFDFVTKPAGPSPQANLAALRDEVLPRIRACARQRYGKAPAPPTRAAGSGHDEAPALPSPAAATLPPAPRAVRLPRARRPQLIRAIVIGASTGGPRAMSAILPDLCAQVAVPILIVQHMPPDFTRSLAESLARQTGRDVVEAGDGVPLTSAAAFIAPGGRHLVVRGSAAMPVLGLSDAPPENGCRPSADVLFRSAAAVLGPGTLAIILTGMGCDGTAGLGAIRRAGGYVIAQDEATSIVWGMPGSAVEAGVADEVLPLADIARAAAAIAAPKSAG